MIFIGNRYEITDKPVYIEENKLYNAYDSEKNVNVKIKIIENSRYISLDFIPNLIDESLMINELHSPYILNIVDVGVHRTMDNLLYYIVYENFQGVSLSTLNKGAYLHLDALIRIATQIVKALQTYSANGKCHGSLKPNDILVDDKYNIKITDFGMTEANRGTNIRCSGNLRYLSPSQLSIDFTDMKTDLYCLGLILYEAIFKKFPFDEVHTEKQLMKAIDKGVIWSKISINNENKDFIRIVKRLLERNKKLCYQNYNELLTDLTHFMYKTQKINVSDIEMYNKPNLEEVLDKTGKIDPDDFYKTSKIYLKDIEDEIEKEHKRRISRQRELELRKTEEDEYKSKKSSGFKKILIVFIILLIIGSMIYSMTI